MSTRDSDDAPHPHGGWGGPPWARGRVPWWAREPGPRSAWSVVFLPAFLVFVQIGGTLGAARRDHDFGRPLDALAMALVVAGPVALLARRRWPVITLVVIAAVTVAYFARDYPGGPMVLSLAVALFGAVSRGRRLAAWLTAGAILLTYLVRGYLDDHIGLGEFAAICAWTLVVLAVAEIARVRRQQFSESRRKFAEMARRRTSEERLSIARELHDMLAHNISLINVQAGVALHLLDENPEQARTALAAIKKASKETLREMRSVLGVLRRVDEDAPRAPAPSLSRVDELVATARAAGVDLTVEVRGERRDLPASTDQAAFRILQESLTNITRHSAAPRATASLAFEPDRLRIRVDDDGPARPAEHADSGGNGIPGMVERAQALGGELTAVAKPGGGFRVTASLPAPSSTQEEAS